jgi:hypothetical protein
LPDLNYKSNTSYRTFNPPCYVIVGNKSDLTENELKSFEYFRRSMHDVHIMTFDEVVYRLENIVQNFSVSELIE